jgi:hypothetical protein
LKPVSVSTYGCPAAAACLPRREDETIEAA